MPAGNAFLLLVPTETADGADHPSPTPGKRETCEEGGQDESSTLCEGLASDPNRSGSWGTSVQGGAHGAQMPTRVTAGARPVGRTGRIRGAGGTRAPAG